MTTECLGVSLSASECLAVPRSACAAGSVPLTLVQVNDKLHASAHYGAFSFPHR